jgi:simple sugar transport system ATP-binding protein
MTLLELRGIGMEYGAIRALAEVDYAVAQGEIVGLIGDNGAGKSTLVKIIAGNFPPTHGTMHFDGYQVRFRGPEDARNAGIEVVYQDLALADNLSGAANVFLGRELRRRVVGLGIMDHAAMTRRAARLFAELKSETRPEALVRTLSGGQRQAVAIAVVTRKLCPCRCIGCHQAVSFRNARTQLWPRFSARSGGMFG